MGTIPTPPTFSSGAVLTAANLNALGSVLTFLANPPMCLAYATGTVSMTNATSTLIPFAGELVDRVQSGDTPMHDISTNNSRIYVRTAGVYEVTGQVVFASNATGARTAAVRLNGTDIIYGVLPAASGVATYVQVPIVQALASAGDYFELTGYQTSGGALSSAGTTRPYNYLSVKFISA